MKMLEFLANKTRPGRQTNTHDESFKDKQTKLGGQGISPL
jgi:hypothetical protein